MLTEHIVVQLHFIMALDDIHALQSDHGHLKRFAQSDVVGKQPAFASKDPRQHLHYSDQLVMARVLLAQPTAGQLRSPAGIVEGPRRLYAVLVKSALQPDNSFTSA